MPKLFGVSVVLGSGKPETPWSRMQAENLSNRAIVLRPALDPVPVVLKDPQPAITSTPDTTAAAAATGTRSRARWNGTNIPPWCTGCPVTPRLRQPELGSVAADEVPDGYGQPTRSLNPPSQAAGVLPGDRLPAASTRKALERPSATSTIEMIRSRFSPAGASCLGGGYPIRAIVADVHPIHHPPHTTRSVFQV